MQTARPTLQTQLFPAVDTQTVYEQPLNERMRCLLRLEYLFQSIAESMSRETAWDARNAIAGMLDVTDQLTRADIKGARAHRGACLRNRDGRTCAGWAAQ